MHRCFILLLFAVYACIGIVRCRKAVAIVGGGVGGVVSAARLAQQGFRVTIFEKNNECGGRMNSEQQGNYRFDIGPSLLLLPSVYQETFELLNNKLSDYVDIRPVNPFYRCFFEEDLSSVDISPNPAIMEHVIEALEPGAWPEYQRYIAIATNFLNFGLPNVIAEQWNSTYLLAFIAACLQTFPLLSHHFILAAAFKSPKIRALLSFQDLYVGLSPFEAPSIFSLLQALEFNQGIYYPIGGFERIAKSLAQIAVASGVVIKTQHSVIQLHKSVEGLATHLTVRHDAQEEEHYADIFIINQDTPEAEQALFPAASQELRLLQARPSCGVVSLSFGFDKELTPLAHHSIFFSGDYERSWDTVAFPETSVFDSSRFNFYVHAPARTDPSCCPAGHDAITVLVPVPPLRKDGSIAYDPAVIRQAVLSRMQAVKGMPPGIDLHIKEEAIRDPVTWRSEFGLFRGSAFGLAHSLNQLSLLRPNIVHPNFNNVFRVGASTRPGNGVPLVMIGAKLVSDAILNMN